MLLEFISFRIYMLNIYVKDFQIMCMHTYVCLYYVVYKFTLTFLHQKELCLSLKILNVQRDTLFTRTKTVLLLFEVSILWRSINTYFKNCIFYSNNILMWWELEPLYKTLSFPRLSNESNLSFSEATIY